MDFIASWALTFDEHCVLGQYRKNSLNVNSHFFYSCISFRSLVCMEGLCLVLPIEHLGESVQLLLQLFQQFNPCPYQVMEAAAFLLLLLLMMGFPQIDLQLRQPLKTSNCTGTCYTDSMECALKLPLGSLLSFL